MDKVPSFYSYRVEPTADGMFAVICDQTGKTESIHEEEWWADHVASESYCDDGEMIRHEAGLRRP